MNENKYTSFDFMKMFGIKRGSWNNIKTKYNLDMYSEKIIDGKQIKFLYTQEAYEILKENYQRKVVEEVKENPKMFSLIQENETLKATLNEYKVISIKFEGLYNEEREKRENLLISNAEISKENDILKNSNETYLQKNKELEQELYKLKNRNFFERLFNK